MVECSHAHLQYITNQLCDVKYLVSHWYSIMCVCVYSFTCSMQKYHTIAGKGSEDILRGPHNSKDCLKVKIWF